MVKGNMDSMEAVGQLQRRQVVKKLMELLKSCYPAEHEYLLLRSKQYESMCYSRASTIHHYYQLVSEGFRKIRTAYNGQLPTASNSALPTSAGQQVSAGIHNAHTSLGATAQGARHAPTVTSQAAKIAAIRTYNLANKSNSINPPQPSDPAGPAIPVNHINPVVYPTNLQAHVHKPVNQQMGHIPANKEGFIVNPATTMNQPFSAGTAQIDHFANPPLNRMIYTSAPSVTNPPVHQMFKPVQKPITPPNANPSLNQISGHIPVHHAANPFVNYQVFPGINHSINQINSGNSAGIINNMSNPRQAPYKDPGPTANQIGITAVSPTGIRPREAHHVAAPVQASGVETSRHQPHSNGVNHLLLSMGMIPEGMISAFPNSNVNISGMPMGNSNQVLTSPRKPTKLQGGMSTEQNTNQNNRSTSIISHIPVSRAHSASSQPRSATRGTPGVPFSHGMRPVSTSSIGSKRPRPRERTVPRSLSKKRNSSAARINAQEDSSPPAKHSNLESAMEHALNPAYSGIATSSQQQNPLQAIASTRLRRGGPSGHAPSADGRISLSDESMKQRVFISDGIHVSLGQVYSAAASCGYKLTAEKIKSLSKAQVLRFFIRARQLALKKACDLPHGENGQVNVSRQQLDTLGVEYQTNEPPSEQTGKGKATLNGIQNSSSQIAQRDPLRTNMERNAIGMMTRSNNLTSAPYQANKPSQSAPKIKSRNSVQELPDHRDPGNAEGPCLSMRRASSCKNLTGSAAPATGKLSAPQYKAAATEAHAVSSKSMRAGAEHGAGNLPVTSQKLAATTKSGFENQITAVGAQPSQKFPADTRILHHCTATISSRVTLFQEKYAVYKNLINQTLNALLSMGHEGKQQVVYMRYSMQLLTQPAALGPKLTIGLLNTTENFLRDFLVRYQGIPMKSQPNQSNQTDALRERGSPAAKNNGNRKKPASAQIGTMSQAQIAASAHVEKETEITQPTTSKADRQAISGARTDQIDPTAKPEDPKTRQTGTSATLSTQPSAQPSAQLSAKPSAQPSVSMPTNPVPDVGVQNMNPASAAVPVENLDSVIAQKLNTINHYVRMALHVTDKCEKGLEQESMLRLKDERISEICNLFQDDDRKKPPEPKTAKAEEAPEASLLEVIKGECDAACKQHKKLMIKITEKWKKPVVECLVAYQCIRLPKMIIHVGGTYRKDLSASFNFEKPPFGWVPVLTDIKKRFIALMDQEDGVSGLLKAWASAAKEVLEDDEVEKK